MTTLRVLHSPDIATRFTPLARVTIEDGEMTYAMVRDHPDIEARLEAVKTNGFVETRKGREEQVGEGDEALLADILETVEVRVEDSDFASALQNHLPGTLIQVEP